MRSLLNSLQSDPASEARSVRQKDIQKEARDVDKRGSTDSQGCSLPLAAPHCRNPGASCCRCPARRHGARGGGARGSRPHRRQACQPGVERELEDGQAQQQVVHRGVVDACRGGRGAQPSARGLPSSACKEPTRAGCGADDRIACQAGPSPTPGPAALTVGPRLCQDGALQGADLRGGVGWGGSTPRRQSRSQHSSRSRLHRRTRGSFAPCCCPQCRLLMPHVCPGAKKAGFSLTRKMAMQSEP